jgi:hypothetical protein
MATDTECTQSGNSRFLAYISSWWKNQPWLLGEGGAPPPPFTLVTITYKVAVCTPAERADTLPLFSSLPLYVLCGKYFQLALEPMTGLQLKWWKLLQLGNNMFGCLYSADLYGKGPSWCSMDRKNGPLYQIWEEIGANKRGGVTPRWENSQILPGKVKPLHTLDMVRKTQLNTLDIWHNRFRSKQKADIA